MRERVNGWWHEKMKVLLTIAHFVKIPENKEEECHLILKLRNTFKVISYNTVKAIKPDTRECIL